MQLNKHKLPFQNLFNLSPIPGTDKFIAMHNFTTYVIDSDRNVIGQRLEERFPYTKKLADFEEFCQRKTCVWHSNMYHSVYHNGSYYIQVFDEVYKVNENGISVVDVIPDLDYKASVSFYGKIFNIGRDLYCSNGYEVY